MSQNITINNRNYNNIAKIKVRKQNSTEYAEYASKSELSLQEKTVSPSQGTQTIRPDSDYYGLSKVTVNPIPDIYVLPVGIKYVKENGTWDVKNYASVNVDVPSTTPKLQEKTAIANGEITADNGYDGLSKVVVDIPVYDGEVETLSSV